ncbi:MSC_0620 family F1-like ATPase-associated subunit [Mycoplasma enhydrae]|uniref:MSC_0620 family F1-like ATPase-associated subunit n=1 Tax=Mycoplasma enhydrae TaxID=2499220 RepID=UPI00197B3628|nr:hypothetical protein [Mycoplasma enhydrae]MBN4089644.1 hypothetical protein [Mycoplasma enhydrae]
MSKKLKLFLSLSSASVIIAPTISLVSAKPKEVDPKFDTYLAKAKEETKKAVEKAVENAIKFLETKLEEAKKALATLDPSNASEVQARYFYFEKITNFYKTNKNDIITNPSKYGVHTELPFVISQDKDLQVIKLTYKGRVYENVKIGVSRLAAYEAELKKHDDKVQIEKIKVIKNTLTEAEFNLSLKKYTDSLVENFNNMIYQQADVPKYEWKISLKWNPATQKIETEIKAEWKLPEGFTTWEDHFKKTLTPRFNEFDITHSKETEFVQEEDEDPEKPEHIPLVPGDKPKPIERDDIDALPPLAPLVRSANLKLSVAELIAQFNKLKSEGKLADANKLFIFNNPVNTRYIYEIEELKDSSGALSAKIKISDSVKTKKKRFYNTIVELNSADDYVKDRLILENQIEEIQRVFKKFFVSLDLDEKIDYDHLGNDNLQETVFTMVEIAGKLINSDKEGVDFRNTWQLDRKNLRAELNSASTDSVIQKAKDNIKDLFILSLLNSVVNLNYKVGDKKVEESHRYWDSVTKAYEKVLDQFKDSIFKNRAIIENNFKSNKLKSRTLENLFEKVKRDLLKLRGESVEKNPISVDAWYNRYLSLVKEIKHEFNVLRDLATIKKADDTDKKENKKFLDANAAANKVIKDSNFAQSNLRKILGSVLMAIGALSTLISLISMLAKLKTNKKRKVLIIYIVILAISLALLASGITLFVLGIN